MMIMYELGDFLLNEQGIVHVRTQDIFLIGSKSPSSRPSDQGLTLLMKTDVCCQTAKD